MKRRTFDLLLSWTGVLLTLVFLVSGILLFVGYNYANNSVRDQLVAQKIFFPPKGSDALKPPVIGTYLNQYAGQQLVNGQQAEAYADHFIAVHLTEVADGQTYAEVSAKALADPTNEQLQGQVATLFKGETLRGMLLNAYAFWKVGQIALWAGIGAFMAAAIMGLLTILGFVHVYRTPQEATIGAPVDARELVNA
jgi:hypothetical protein